MKNVTIIIFYNVFYSCLSCLSDLPKHENKNKAKQSKPKFNATK